MTHHGEAKRRKVAAPYSTPNPFPAPFPPPHPKKSPCNRDSQRQRICTVRLVQNLPKQNRREAFVLSQSSLPHQQNVGLSSSDASLMLTL